MNKIPAFIVRPAEPADLAVIPGMCARSVLQTCQSDYTEEQLKAWSDALLKPAAWEKRLSEHQLLVAIWDQQIAGVASRHGAQIDMVYTDKHFQGQGVASLLVNSLEKAAREVGIPLVTCDVSKTALSFFRRLGYQVVERRYPALAGVNLTNFRMVKHLDLINS